MTTQPITIIGAGLAGSEAAWQIASRGIPVTLYEMRPQKPTGAHQTDHCAELVCSNSLGSQLADRASGVLLNECRQLGSLLTQCAFETSVPAGGALAVDRERFSERVTSHLENHPLITLVRKEKTEIPQGPCIIASGPLTSEKLSARLADLTGMDHLYFFDAISPIVTKDSLNFDIIFRASRYQKGESAAGDYLNCPFNKEQYESFVNELLAAERIPLHSFEQAIAKGVKAGAHQFFEGCLPIEILASRGLRSLAFGPMRPVGLVDQRTQQKSYAVLQLRQDNVAGDLYNLVGFQTNLKFGEQDRVLRLIPGLEKAEFVRYGQMHRNTFLNAPRFLKPSLQFKTRDDLFFAGQLTGVEGYLGNIATGLLAGINATRYVQNQSCVSLPRETMLGALCHYITAIDEKHFQPMKANFGILPELSGPKIRSKPDRMKAYAARADEKMGDFVQQQALNSLIPVSNAS